MQTVLINLKDNDSISDFVSIISGITVDMDLSATNSKQVVDAKSIIGVLALDRTHDVILTIHTNDEKQIRDIKNIIKHYIV